MYSLRKIKELNGFRFFKNYKWNESECDLFGKHNLIYGWNGCGKTTLCDFFYDLEIGRISTENVTFSLLFQNSESETNSTITHNKIGSIPYVFKVFHQNYIQENISRDMVKHIFTVGKEQALKVEEIKRLRGAITEEEAKFKRLSGEAEDLVQEFEKLKAAKAKLIKEAAGYSNAYNKNAFFTAYSKQKGITDSSEADYQNALKAAHAAPMAEIPISRYSFMQGTVKDYICNILSQTPINNTIDALKQDPPVSSWVEQGLHLHETREQCNCLFCGNPISEIRFEALRSHFNKSYKELSEKIDGAISLLQTKIDQFNTAKTNLPSYALFYPEYRTEYLAAFEQAQLLCDKYSSIISEIIAILWKKKADMINDSYEAVFVGLVDQLDFDYSVFDIICNLIQKHNQKTKDFQGEISRAQKAIEQHLIASFYDEVAIMEKRVSDKAHEASDQNTFLQNLLKNVAKLEQEVKNSQIPADAINRDIEFIMGRSELVFENHELGYRILRNGKRAKNLSKGEENAIALIYFFNTLLDVESDAARTIIVLDDPISSFDSNFYYNAISYIREKAEAVGQVFVFTHKFSLQKDFFRMFGSNTKRYTIQRHPDGPHIVNEDKLIEQYHDEYAYLFKKIYYFVKEPPADTREYLQYPNIARRLLEGFLTFKLPSSDTIMDKVLQLENGKNSPAGRAVLRLLNNQSHLRVIPMSDNSDDIDNIAILPDTLNHLMEFIKYHDERHYNTLASLCDSSYSADGAAVKIIQLPTKTVKFYEMAASAGPGDFLENDPDAQEMVVHNEECTFAVKISGDSMEPVIPDGSIALVKQCEQVASAHIGIVWYSGKCYCKKIVQSPKGVLLVSENKEYPPIPIDSPEEFHIYGEVIEIIKPVEHE